MEDAKLIKEIREKHGYSQVALAELLGFTDGQPKISLIENGKYKLSSSKRKLAEILLKRGEL